MLNTDLLEEVCPISYRKWKGFGHFVEKRVELSSRFRESELKIRLKFGENIKD